MHKYSVLFHHKAKSKNREDRAIDIKHINRVDPQGGSSGWG